MMPIPPLNLNNSAESEAKSDQFGNAFTLGNSGAWNVNVGGSAPSIQSAADMPMWVWIAAGVAVAVWLLKK